jgi:hypothetical protein
MPTAWPRSRARALRFSTVAQHLPVHAAYKVTTARPHLIFLQTFGLIDIKTFGDHSATGTTIVGRPQFLEIDERRLGEVLLEQRPEWARVVLGVPRLVLSERRHDVWFRCTVFAR